MTTVLQWDDLIKRLQRTENGSCSECALGGCCGLGTWTLCGWIRWDIKNALTKIPFNSPAPKPLIGWSGAVLVWMMWCGGRCQYSISQVSARCGRGRWIPGLDNLSKRIFLDTFSYVGTIENCPIICCGRSEYHTNQIDVDLEQTSNNFAQYWDRWTGNQYLYSLLRDKTD